jgi:hypothetical protein
MYSCKSAWTHWIWCQSGKPQKKPDISVQCVFNNRHKFLSLLAEILQKEEILMTGTIEGDETYVLESTKGSNPENRKSRHR